MPSVFICHSTLDAEFVIQVAKHLKPSCSEVFYYETQQRADETFQKTIDDALMRCDHFVVFVGCRFSHWQEIEAAYWLNRGPGPKSCVVRLPGASYPPPGLGGFIGSPRIDADPTTENAPLVTAWGIMRHFGRPLRSLDGLPFNPSLFSYEKDIIDFFGRRIGLGLRAFSPVDRLDDEDNLNQFHGREDVGGATRAKLLDGCPSEWPTVTRWDNADSANTMRPPSSEAMRQPLGEEQGGARREDAYVVAAALSTYHEPSASHCGGPAACMIQQQLYFPEAGPRQRLYFPADGPLPDNALRVGILVAGGIAPGINAVIDGIVQRHWTYARLNGYRALISGIKNGLSAIKLPKRGPGSIDDSALVTIAPSENDLTPIPPNLLHWEKRFSPEHAREGGSMIGTSRVDDLIRSSDRSKFLLQVVNALAARFDILYVIGGDGSMKLAHALWQCANVDPEHGTDARQLSVVAVPKTMDNDILWMWQAFGFLSAVEKAREILTHLDTEIKSNPRLCVLQLFGSDSGFVVSHTVAASGSDQCDAALIPEVRFSLRGLARFLQLRMCQRKKDVPSAVVPSGLVVMAETAIPTDAICYADGDNAPPSDILADHVFIRERIGLSEEALVEISRAIKLTKEERDEIYEFHRKRRRGERIQGQTSDTLRNAGLKIVSRGLEVLLKLPDGEVNKEFLPPKQPDWGRLRRVLTNEPRHVLRAIAPTCSDIIMGQRLGTLAVDNAMAGYTDFMISQWLTEFVLVPLKLVVLGRKRIPKQGMFWKSVLAKTRQPANLDVVGPLLGEPAED